MASIRTYNKDTLFSEVKALAKSRGGKVLSNAYISAKTKLKMECAEGHQFEINQSNLKNGGWCATCGRVQGALARKALKGDTYLVEICKGRTIKCLDVTFRGVKAKNRFLCLTCNHQWDSTPDNIGQGKGCPPCSKGVGKILEPAQKGKMITYPLGTFGEGASEVRTFGKTQVQFTGRVRDHYEALVYQSSMNSLLWVSTSDMPPTSSYKLSFECLMCGGFSKRPLYNAIQTRGCGLCYGKQIGDTLRMSVSSIEKKFGIRVVSYVNSAEPLQYEKPCGCKMAQALDVLNLTGVGYCAHDSEYTWRTFEILIRDFLKAEKATKAKHGVSADCITPDLLVETKLDIKAVYSNYGRRTPLDAIELYKTWAEANDRKFYVVVNAADEILRDSGLPSYYLGWESWSKAGLTKSAIATGKKIAKRPQGYRVRKPSKEDELMILNFRKMTKRLKRVPKMKELKEGGFSIARLAMAVLGTNDGSLVSICEALKINEQQFQIPKNQREGIIQLYLDESSKAGYLISAAMCEEKVGVSLNRLMAWVLGNNQFSMARLKVELKTSLPLEREYDRT